MYTLYGDHRSGHCYKIKLICSLLDIDYQWVEVDLLEKEHLSADYLALNPKHQVPVLVINNLVIDDSNHKAILTESNAILNYLATGSDLIPTNSLNHAQMLQWQFYEQSKFQPPISAIRWIKHYQNMPAERLDEYHEKLALAKDNFAYLDKYLAKHQFLVNETVTLADITLFAYAHMANEGGIESSNYPNVVKWLERIKSQPRFVSIKI